MMRISWLAVPLLLATVAFAEEDPHAACAAPPMYVPADLLERPAPLRTGIGNSHEKVTTSSPEAQAFYDQGLNYLESFVWIEASRSFHQALRLDPKMAMAYVGLSRTHSGLDDPGGAKKFLEAAKKAEGASERERRRIRIRELQLAAIDDLEDAGKLQAYRKAIDEALTADSDNPTLWVLRGNAEEPNASGRGQRGTESSVAFYKRALRLVPDHASAHHYLVHSYETVGRIDDALRHGEAYARLAPAIPHAAHMWGHDLRRVGRVDDAIAQFLKTDALERRYYAAEKLEPKMDWHHGHNLDLLATCYQHKGQMKLAEERMREAGSLEAVEAYRAFARRELPNFLIHRARYEEALDEALAMTKIPSAQAHAVGHALAGQALLALGRNDEAKKQLEAAKRELEQVPRVTPGVVPGRGAVEPWVEALRGEILLRTGDRDEGRAVLVSVQKQLRAVLGPDAWTQALFRLETMARTAREVGDWKLADHTARQMLDHDPAYAGSHYAMALVLAHGGDQEGARKSLATARQGWRDADPELPELRAIETTMAALR